MTRWIAVTAVLVAAGFVILRLFTHLAPGDIASAIVAEATAILAVLTYVSLREAQRQGRLSIRREHLRDLKSSALADLRSQFESFYSPIFEGYPALPYCAPPATDQPGSLRRFEPKVLLQRS
jgi:hypothetical protein